MNSRFNKYLKSLNDGAKSASVEEALNELHKSFAALTQEEQRFANIFLHDVQRGDIQLAENKTLRDYITEYQFRAKEDRIHHIAISLDLDETKLRQLINSHITENNIDEFGRFAALKNSVDKTKAKQYFEQRDGIAMPAFKVNIEVDKLLRILILKTADTNTDVVE